MALARFKEHRLLDCARYVDGEPLRLWPLPLIAAALVVSASVVDLPSSAIAVLGGTAVLLLAWSQPWLGFAFLFATEVLCTEDRLLQTEKLAPTIYYDRLPVLGCNVFELGMLVLIFSFLVRNRWRPIRSRMDVPVLAFMLIGAVGFVTGGVLSGDWTHLYEPRRLFHFFAAYLLAVNLLDDRRKVFAFLLIFMAATGLKGIHGVWLYSQGEGLLVKWRMRAIFTGWGDGLNFATYLLVLAAFWFRRIRLPAQSLWFVLALPVTFSFLMSYKRAYYVALAAGVAVLFVLFDAPARKRLIAYGAVMGAAGVLLLAVGGKLDMLMERILSIAQPKKESSANYRLIEWQNALIAIRAHPWAGIGLGGVLAMVVFLPRTNLLGVHNTFLWSATKMGVLGLLATLWLFVAAFSVALRDRRLRRGVDRVTTEAFLAILGGFTAAAVFAPMFHQTRTSFWFGAFVGVLSIFGEPHCRLRRDTTAGSAAGDSST